MFLVARLYIIILSEINIKNMSGKIREKKNSGGNSQEINAQRDNCRNLHSLMSNLKVSGEMKSKTKKLKEDDSKKVENCSLKEQIAIEGNLTVHSQNLLKHEKKTVHYFSLFPASKSGRARLQQSASVESAANNLKQPELLLLSPDIIKVQDLANSDADDEADGHKFLIQSKAHTLVLSAASAKAKNRWIMAIQEVLLSDCDSPTRKTAHHFSSLENISLPRTFQVKISKKTQVRIGDDSPVDLVVEVGSLSAITSTKVRLVKWTLPTLRKYGFTDSTFWVEAGSKSEDGEGEYEFLTQEGENIFHSVKAARRSYGAEGEHVLGLFQPSSLPPRPLQTVTDHPSNIYEPFDAAPVDFLKTSTKEGPQRLYLPMKPGMRGSDAGLEALYADSNPYTYKQQCDFANRKTYSGPTSRTAKQMKNELSFTPCQREMSKSVTAFPIVPRKVPIVGKTSDGSYSTRVPVPPVPFTRVTEALPKFQSTVQNSPIPGFVPGASPPKVNIPPKPGMKPLQPTIVHQHTSNEPSPLRTSFDGQATAVGDVSVEESASQGPNAVHPSDNIYAVVDMSKKTKKIPLEREMWLDMYMIRKSETLENV